MSEKCFEKLQPSPTEDKLKEIPAAEGKYKLCVNCDMPLKCVAILNKDESGENVVHQIRIEGEKGEISRTLIALTHALENIDSTKTSRESAGMQEVKKLIEKGEIVIRDVSKPFSWEDLREFELKKSLPEYKLNVRWSRYPDADIIFIIKGTEKEDNSTFIIQVENGDYVSVSKENLHLLIEKLKAIYMQN